MIPWNSWIRMKLSLFPRSNVESKSWNALTNVSRVLRMSSLSIRRSTSVLRASSSVSMLSMLRNLPTLTIWNMNLICTIWRITRGAKNRSRLLTSSRINTVVPKMKRSLTEKMTMMTKELLKSSTICVRLNRLDSVLTHARTSLIKIQVSCSLMKMKATKNLMRMKKKETRLLTLMMRRKMVMKRATTISDI